MLQQDPRGPAFPSIIQNFPQILGRNPNISRWPQFPPESNLSNSEKPTPAGWKIPPIFYLHCWYRALGTALMAWGNSLDLALAGSEFSTIRKGNKTRIQLCPVPLSWVFLEFFSFPAPTQQAQGRLHLVPAPGQKICELKTRELCE